MSSFTNWITDNPAVALAAFPKSFVYRVPTEADPKNYSRDVDMNDLYQAARDVQAWLRGAPFLGLAESASALVAGYAGAGVTKALWAKTDHRLYVNLDGTDRKLLVEGLAGAYSTMHNTGGAAAGDATQRATLTVDGTHLAFSDDGLNLSTHLDIDLTASFAWTGAHSFSSSAAPTIPKIKGGGSNTLGHVVPNAADDTFALLSAAQVLSNKTLGSDLAGGNFKITGLADPTQAQHAATKAYVDAAAVGIDWKPSVRVATTGNITLSGTQTIDGVAVVANDRVLVKSQGTGANNGIYVAASGAWARATDADTSAEVTSGMAMYVSEGTANSGTCWLLTTADPITLGATALSFTQFAASTLTAGDGLVQVGNAFNVGAGTGVTVAADSISVAYGTSGGTATQGNDTRLPVAPSLLGGTLYDTGSAWSALAGNTTATKKFLRSTGSGGLATAPAWDTLVAGDLPNTAVTPGSYTYTSLTVDAQGRITSATSGAVTSGTVTQITMGTGLSSTQSPLTTSGTMSIDQSFTPTWTGLHTYQQAVSTGLTPGVSLQTTSTATVGAQKNSLGLELVGSGWGTTGGAAQAVKALFQLVPVQSTTAQADVVLYTLAGGGAYAETLRIGHNEAVGGISTSNVLLMKSNSNAANYINSGTELLIRVGSNDSYATWGGLDFTQTTATIYASSAAVVAITSTGLRPSSDLVSTIGDSTHRWLKNYSNHNISPLVSWAVGTGAGQYTLLTALGSTGAVSNMAGGDECGVLTLTAGGTGITAGALIDIYFSKTYTTAPSVIVVGRDGNTMSLDSFYADTTTTKMTIYAQYAPSSGTANKLQWMVKGWE